MWGGWSGRGLAAVTAAAFLLVQVPLMEIAKAESAGARVEVQRSGGVTGPARPLTVRVNGGAMTEKERSTLDGLVADADFFDQPQSFPGPVSPNAMETRVTVEQGGRAHTVTFREGDAHPPQLDALADWVWSHRKLN